MGKREHHEKRRPAKSARDEVDLILRHVSRQFPRDLARALLRRRDGLRPPSIESVVVVLSGRDEPWPTHGAYQTSAPGEPFSGVHFRIEPVYQRTVAELEARGSLLWLIFAPLAVDADEDKLRRVVETLRTRTPERDFAELGAAMAVLAFADRRKRGLGDVVEKLLPKELTMGSYFFREAEEAGMAKGLAKGRAEGRAEGQAKGWLQALAHQLERRLGRRLKPRERTRLSERLSAEGHAKIGDLILDLSAEDLAAWLASSDGAPRRVSSSGAPSSRRQSPGSPRGRASSRAARASRGAS